MFDAHVLKLLIASPSDTGSERDAVERAIHGWNAARAEREQIMFAPWRWETNAVPEMGGSAQSIINSQAVDACDLVIAIFDSRLGTATDAAVSGTAEEIQRATAAGKPVHVWFSGEPLPRDTTAKELGRLEKFKAQMMQAGLLGSYANPEDLQFQVRNAIEHDLTKLDLGRLVVRQGSSLQARKVVVRRSRQRVLGEGFWTVEIINDSATPITGLEVQVSAMRAEAPVEITPAKGELGHVIGKLMTSAIGGGLASSVGTVNAQMAGQHFGSIAQAKLQQEIAAAVATEFDSAVGGQKQNAVVFRTDPLATVSVQIAFDDENGVRWTRVDDGGPVRM